MQEWFRVKKSLVRETMSVTISEEELLGLVKAKVEEKYPDFVITEMEIQCGMGQGQGFFENVRLKLVSEREEKEVVPSKK